MSIKVMSRVWETSQHSGSALLMLLAIADFSDDEGNAYPAVPKLAKKCRMTPRNANLILATLRDSGELEILQNKGIHGTNLYKILECKGLKPASPPKPASALKPASSTPEAGFPKPLKPASDNPSLNHQEPSGPQKTKFPACPHQAIRDLYHEVLPELPKARLMGDDRKKSLGAFWKWVFTESRSDGTPRATTADEALAWVRGYFTRARDNDFLMGRVAKSDGHSTWQCDLDFLLTPKGKKQVIEKTRGAA